VPKFINADTPRPLKSQEKCDFADTLGDSCEGLPPFAQKGGNWRAFQLVAPVMRVLNFRHNN
jgi:hypothetical protein